MNWNGERLKYLIEKVSEETGLSKSRIAEAIGLSQTNMNKYILGVIVPKLDTLEQIADYFAVPMDYLLGRCSLEQAKAVEENYGEHFRVLQSESYEKYLVNRPKTKFSTTSEPPYPYNLISKILCKEVTWVVSEQNIEGLEYALDQISSKRKAMIESYFKDRKTFREIGEEYGTSAEVVRTNIEQGLRRMRSPHITQKILRGNMGEEAMERAYEDINRREAKLNEKEKELNAERERLKAVAEAFRKLAQGGLSREEFMEYAKIIKIRDLGWENGRELFSLLRRGANTLADVVDMLDKGKLWGRGVGAVTLGNIIRVVNDITGSDYTVEGVKERNEECIFGIR